jgi:hypothetical protein
LNGGKADAKAGERAGTARDHEQVERGRAQPGLAQRTIDLARQALAMRPRLVACHQRQQLSVAHNRGAAAACRRVERENEHAV